MRISNLYKNKELRKKVLVLFACLGLFKVGMHVYVPFVDRSVLEEMSNGGGLLSVMNTFTGGALSNFSIFAIGIMPYITASIIIQLLQMDVVPYLTDLRNQGEYGQKKIKRITYVTTVVLALVQSLMMSYGFNKMYDGLIPNPSILTFSVITIVLTLGTVILMILGEVIDKKGIGKGISLIIVSGILMTLPDNIAMYYDSEFTGVDEKFLSVIKTVLLGLFVYTMLVMIIIVNGGERRIPIHTPSSSEYGISQNKRFLPIKINVSGVIPVIFASAFFSLPMTIQQFTGESKFGNFVNNYLSFNSWIGILLYAVIIILLTYFYAFIQFDPEKVTKNLSQSNSYIPTIRQGQATTDYLTGVLTRLTLVGSVFLATVSVLPMLLGQVITLPQQLLMSGTSVIIIVSVVVEFKTQIMSELTKSKYERVRANKDRYGSIFGKAK